MSHLKLRYLGPLIIDLDDVFAARKQEPRDFGVPYGDGEGDAEPRVSIFTRLRESGSRDPLLSLEFAGSRAREAWESFEEMTCADASDPPAFVRFGSWYIRPARVRAMTQIQSIDWSVFMSMPDENQSGGWVARLTLNDKAGTALDAWMQQRRRELQH